MPRYWQKHIAGWAKTSLSQTPHGTEGQHTGSSLHIKTAMSAPLRFTSFRLMRCYNRKLVNLNGADIEVHEFPNDAMLQAQEIAELGDELRTNIQQLRSEEHTSELQSRGQPV